MNLSLSSMGRVLRAPWQQRRNQRTLWGLALILLLSALVPVALFVSGTMVADRHLIQPRSDVLLRGVELTSLVVLGLWAVGAWALLVANVLEQNHPTFARLVPRHVQHVRAVLLSAWLVLIALAAAGPGLFVQAPLAWAAIAAAGLAVLAAAVRWPMLWMTGIFAPVLTVQAMHQAWIDALLRALLQTWQASPLAITIVIVIAGAAGLASLVQAGGARHEASHAARRSRNLRFQSRVAGVQPLTAVDGASGWTTRLSSIPYAWWMRRVLARADSPLRPRLLLALGPGSHWITRVGGVFVLLALGGAFVVAALQSPSSRELPATLSGLSFGMVFGLVLPTVQAQARLHQTRREQALLMLLPGVPRGAMLNRWLCGHLTLNFALSWLAAGALVTMLGACAERLNPGEIVRNFGQGRELMMVAVIPLAAFQWRRWYRMAPPTQLSAVFPPLAALALAAAAYGLRRATGLGYLEIGVVLTLGSLAWGAVRWRRMGNEPSAFPVGRLHA